MVSKQFASKLPFLRVWMAFAVILIHSWSEVGGVKSLITLACLTLYKYYFLKDFVG